MLGESGKIISINHVVRRVRGGSQGYLVRGSDDQFYVAKFVSNPQGTTTLVNEWLAAHAARKLGICTAENVLLMLTKSREELFFSLGPGRVAIQPGIHFGSRVPVNLTATTLFDFLPRPLLPKVSNLCDFIRALVLDLWLCNLDSRQAIFSADRTGRRGSFRAYFIDHGACFGGSSWDVRTESSRRGVYVDEFVYSLIGHSTAQDLAMEAVEKAVSLDLTELKKGLPASWLEPGQLAELDCLLGEIESRKTVLRELSKAKLHSIQLSPNRDVDSVAIDGDRSLSNLTVEVA